MADIQMNKIDLEALIRDCLEAYTEETLEFEIPWPDRSATDQCEEISEIPLIFPEQILSFNPTEGTEEASPISTEESKEGPLVPNKTAKTPFTCTVCSKPYSGNRQLQRHMKKHSSPDKFSCTIEGCLKTMHRTDAMRSHIKAHENRLKLGRRRGV
jgi:hypothetical protein